VAGRIENRPAEKKEKDWGESQCPYHGNKEILRTSHYIAVKKKGISREGGGGKTFGATAASEGVLTAGKSDADDYYKRGRWGG